MPDSRLGTGQRCLERVHHLQRASLKKKMSKLAGCLPWLSTSPVVEPFLFCASLLTWTRRGGGGGGGGLQTNKVAEHSSPHRVQPSRQPNLWASQRPCTSRLESLWLGLFYEAKVKRSEQIVASFWWIPATSSCAMYAGPESAELTERFHRCSATCSRVGVT